MGHFHSERRDDCLSPVAEPKVATPPVQCKYYQSKWYRPILVALQGSALWGNTLATALLHDQNRTIPWE